MRSEFVKTKPKNLPPHQKDEMCLPFRRHQVQCPKELFSDQLYTHKNTTYDVGQVCILATAHVVEKRSPSSQLGKPTWFNKKRASPERFEHSRSKTNR